MARLGFPANAVAPATRPRKSGREWMDVSLTSCDCPPHAWNRFSGPNNTAVRLDSHWVPKLLFNTTYFHLCLYDLSLLYNHTIEVWLRIWSSFSVLNGFKNDKTSSESFENFSSCHWRFDLKTMHSRLSPRALEFLYLPPRILQSY